MELGPLVDHRKFATTLAPSYKTSSFFFKSGNSKQFVKEKICSKPVPSTFLDKDLYPTNVVKDFMSKNKFYFSLKTWTNSKIQSKASKPVKSGVKNSDFIISSQKLRSLCRTSNLVNPQREALLIDKGQKNATSPKAEFIPRHEKTTFEKNRPKSSSIITPQ